MPLNKKVVLVHEKFIHYGGAERVFEDIVNSVYEGKPLEVFTLYNSPEFEFIKDPNLKDKLIVHEIVKSPISRLIIKLAYTVKNPFLRGPFQFLAMLFMPIWFSSVKFPEDTQVVLVDSLGFESNVLPPAGAIKVLYVHTPLHVIWGLTSTFFSSKNKIKNIIRKILDSTFFKYLRNANKIGFKTAHVVMCNSVEVKNRIKRFFNIDAVVVNPPVDVDSLQKYTNEPKKDFYVFLNRLEPYKLIMETIKLLPEGKSLKVIGKGSLREKAEGWAQRLNKDIEFLGFVTEDTKFKTLAQAKALLYPNVEDFGIVMVEVLAVGTYVIGNEKGGAAEIVKHKKTGYKIKSIKELPKAIEWIESRFANNEYVKDKKFILKDVKRFSPETFKAKIVKIINDAYKEIEKLRR